MQFYKSNRKWHIFFFCMLMAYFGYGQSTISYNLNINNGLPTNHVYNTLVDKHGYLWLATTHGVIRYNGYDMKVFDLSTGLPREDVWQLVEDPQGKIWLGSFSDEMGYMLNDKYHKVFLKEHQQLFPREMQLYKDGILFLSPDNDDKWDFFIEKNDTLHEYSLNRAYGYEYFLTDNHELIGIRIPNVYKISIPALSKIVVKKIYDRANCFPWYQRFYKNNLIHYTLKSDKIFALNLVNKSIKEIDFNTANKPAEKIFFVYKYDSSLYVICMKNIYKINASLHIVKKYSIDSLANGASIDGDEVSFIYNEPFWGMCLSTSNGLYIQYGANNHFFKKMPSLSLRGYKYVGSSANETGFWWNNSINTLLALGKGMHVMYQIHKTISKIRKIIPYDKDYSLAMVNKNILLLNNNTGATSWSFLPHVSDYVPFGMVATNSNSYYILNYGRVFSFQHLETNRGHYHETIIDDDNQYTDIVFDNYRNAIWAYSSRKILILHNNKKIFIDKSLLNIFGINSIEKILIDRYGNIFVKDIEGLFVFNISKLSCRQLFQNTRLKRASVDIYKDRLILTGNFGVLFSKIEGVDQFSNPLFFRNVKSLLYNTVEDVQISGNKLLLKTDEGLYISGLPADSLFYSKENEGAEKYKFIVSYNDTVHNIKQNDTISIFQKSPGLQFDVINPLGSGTPKYRYQLDDDSDWHDLNANELTLPALPAGKYYALKVIVMDNAWQSSPINIHLYIIPYWWQTTPGEQVLWTVSIVVIILLFAVAIFATNRYVTRKNIERNLNLELELKSVYSQINPHFIFNTLSTALYFIKKRKMDDAFEHISTFSDLLRAYIKSSTNKYISIGDEIVNLKNYIELQLKRFEGKFGYTIIVDSPFTNQINIPSLLLQPLVENAINHGLFHKQEKGFLKIEFNFIQSENEVICIIEDDGIGRKEAKRINDSSTVKRPSYGSDLVKSLIAIFNKYEKTDIQIEYIDKEAPLNGTIVKLSIKGKRDGK